MNLTKKRYSSIRCEILQIRTNRLSHTPSANGKHVPIAQKRFSLKRIFCLTRHEIEAYISHILTQENALLSRPQKTLSSPPLSFLFPFLLFGLGKIPAAGKEVLYASDVELILNCKS